MRLYILGNGKEDKGNQLEELTTAILADMGYTYVSRSFIGSGGHEIDVRAKWIQHIAKGKEIETPVVCECKAHITPIDTNDFLKFAGKVLLERMNNGQALGVLIALSGANGYVLGNYDNLPDKSYLHLITQDSLLDIVKRHYNLKDIKEVRSFIEHETLRTIDSIDLVYYRKQVWWLIGYVNGQYSVLTDNMIPIEDEVRNSFLDLLSKSSTFKKADYVNPIEERLSWIRQDIIKKSVVFLLMRDGSQDFSHLMDSLFILCHQQDIDRNEVKVAIQKCSYTILDGETVSLVDESIVNYVDFYRWYCLGQIIVDSVDLPFYRNHIDNALFEEIRHIQKEIDVPVEKLPDCMLILQMSPSALLYALTPDEMIVTSRMQGAQAIPQVNLHHTKVFINSLVDHFMSDLQNKNFSAFYYTHYGLTEYSIDTELNLKFKEPADNRSIIYKNRIGFGQMEGQVITIQLFDKQN